MSISKLSVSNAVQHYLDKSALESKDRAMAVDSGSILTLTKLQESRVNGVSDSNRGLEQDPKKAKTNNSDEIRKEYAEHEKLEANNNYLSSIFKMLNNGNYTTSKLKTLQNLSAANYTTESIANGILNESNLSYIKKIQTLAQEQMEKLKGFDIGVAYEDIKLNNRSRIATSDDYEFAQAVLKQLQQDGDNSVSFNEVLAEVLSGELHSA